MRLDEGQNKRKKMSPVNESASKKVRPTVKELLAMKRDKEKDSDVSVAEAPKPVAGATKVATTDSSSDSNGSSSDSSASESGSEDEDGKDADVVESTGEAKLPNNLPQQLLTAMEDIKKAAASTEQGKCRFFSSEINRLLLS